MKGKEHVNFINKLDKEMQDFEDLQLSYQKQTIMENCKDIFATQCIYMYLSVNAENYSCKKLPKKNILATLVERLYQKDYGISELDIGEMLEGYEEDEMC